MTLNINISSWDEFREHLPGNKGNLSVHPKLWRGQRDSSWKLESSFDRMYRHVREVNNTNQGYSNDPLDVGEDGIRSYRERRDEYLAEFRRFATGLRGMNAQTLTDMEWWALGRHYGLRTPFLDWSERPFIAVFFAVVGLLGQLSRNVGEVGALNLTGATCAIYRLAPDLVKVKHELNVVRPQVEELSRMHNQRGVFTYLDSGQYLDLEDYLHAHDSKASLTKFIIPDKVALEAYRDLHNFGVDWRTMYPDLTGAALATNAYLEVPDDLWDLKF